MSYSRVVSNFDKTSLKSNIPSTSLLASVAVGVGGSQYLVFHLNLEEVEHEWKQNL